MLYSSSSSYPHILQRKKIDTHILQNVFHTRSWYRNKNGIFIADDTVQICNSIKFNANCSNNLTNHDEPYLLLSHKDISTLIIAGTFVCFLFSCLCWWKLLNIDSQKKARKLFIKQQEFKNEEITRDIAYMSHTRNWYKLQSKKRDCDNENDNGNIINSIDNIDSNNSIDTGDDISINVDI